MLRKTIPVILNIILALFIILGFLTAFTLLPIKNNYQMLAVMSGSMEPTIKTGSLIVIKPVTEYNIGDIISSRDVNSRNGKEVITHRIFNKTEKDGITEFTTKGDVNSTADAFPIKQDAIVGKHLATVPYLGYLIGYIKTLPGLILLIIIPATIIIYEESRKIHREAKSILEKRRAKKLAQKKSENSSKSNRANKVPTKQSLSGSRSKGIGTSKGEEKKDVAKDKKNN